ncbi:MAG: hypothetical protein NC131_01200 [Roseburia sp.]|nr:hypothetical protein [Roseburia sp.]
MKEMTNEEIIQNIKEQTRKETAGEILTYIGNLHDDDDNRFKLKDYQWFQNLCNKYGITIK